jgi:aldehyde dehydrogenase (NAD+)
MADHAADAHYVQPAIVEMPAQTAAVGMYRNLRADSPHVMRYQTLDEAIALQNAVPQGLSPHLYQ